MKVYMINKDHKRNLREYNLNDIVDKFNKGLFLEVAEVAGTKLEVAYKGTQNLEQSWDNNEGVQRTPNLEIEYTRSTMVGDIVERNGVYYAVAGCGFNELENIKV